MKRVFYFKLSNLTYSKQEVESTTSKEGAIVKETFIYLFCPKASCLNISVSKSKTYLISKDLLEEDGFFRHPLDQDRKRITRRTFTNNLKRILEQTSCILQSL